MVKLSAECSDGHRQADLDNVEALGEVVTESNKASEELEDVFPLVNVL
jgi:hypothetical protein